MKVYQDLGIRGSRPALDSFISDLERRLNNGWARDHTRESKIRQSALGNIYCFSCTASRARPASNLWIATHADGTLYVSNILAHDEQSSMSYEVYNGILQEFYRDFALPAGKTAGVQVELGNPNPQIEDFLSYTAASLLRSFSGAANRTVQHPLDRKRWNEFLTAAYRERAPLTASVLRKWLIEEEKWPDDEALDLAMQYEQARDLLEVYESVPA